MSSYTAFLRVRHPSMDPAELSSTLGLAPVHAWAAGSARASDTGDGGRGKHPDTYWLAPLGDAGWHKSKAGEAAGADAGKFFWPPLQALPLEAFLLSQLRLLVPHKAFFARLKAEGASCEVSVALAADERWEVDLPPTLLRALADLNIGITIEVSAEAELEA